MTEMEQLKQIIDTEINLKKIQAKIRGLTEAKEKLNEDYKNANSNITNQIAQKNKQLKTYKNTTESFSSYLVKCFVFIMIIIGLTMLFNYLSTIVSPFFAWLIMISAIAIIILLIMRYLNVMDSFMVGIVLFASVVSWLLQCGYFYIFINVLKISPSLTSIITAVILSTTFVSIFAYNHFIINPQKELKSKLYAKDNNQQVKCFCDKKNQELADLTKKYNSYIGKITTEYNALMETEDSELNKLVRLYDILEPNYRNIGIASLFYEYLCQERCYKIKGPDGAYTIYAQERLINAVGDFTSSTRYNISSLYDKTSYLSSRINACEAEIRSIKYDMYEL